jgi:hypothetical protein
MLRCSVRVPLPLDHGRTASTGPNLGLRYAVSTVLELVTERRMNYLRVFKETCKTKSPSPHHIQNTVLNEAQPEVIEPLILSVKRFL